MKWMINIKKETAIYLFLSGTVFIYVLFRALNTGITYDEAWTIKSFVPLSSIEILNYSPCDANNHILNTLLIKLFYFYGKENIFIARLPNVLAFIVYLYYSFKISNYLPIFQGFVVFVLLIINPFLLDFFSLARGYGLGMSFQAGSIYYVLLFAKNKKLRSANYALILASIAVLCNFSQLNYWTACLSTLIIINLFGNKGYKLKLFMYQFIITLFSTLIVYEPIRKLIINKSLYYGGNIDFYSDTLVSLTKYTQYSPVINGYTHIVLNVLLLLLVVGICLLIFRNIKGDFHLYNLENCLFLLLLFAILSSTTQHFLLGTLYLIDRAALFYFPLFILTLCFTFNLTPHLFQKIFFSIVLLFFGFNFFVNANVTKTALWYFDSHTETILKTLNSKGANQNKNITIDFSWPFQSVIYYLNDKKKYPFITIVKDSSNRESININADYYIYLNKSLEKVGYESNNQQILHFKKDTLLFYEKEGIFIFENIKKF